MAMAMAMGMCVLPDAEPDAEKSCPDPVAAAPLFWPASKEECAHAAPPSTGAAAEAMK